ncbi:hypothetical protein C8Q77DRAFT_1058093 [Trametes polyzona]|nr:hypothetical protein C8Q77DRAFT_1058093 [Trametes polyzona]
MDSDTLPVEVFHRILKLACTDGGNNGLSLLLVSKSFYAVARTTRFNSITLAASPRRLQSFVAHFERERDPELGYTARVRHLYVIFPHVARNHIEITLLRTSHPGARTRSLSPPRRKAQDAPSDSMTSPASHPDMPTFSDGEEDEDPIDPTSTTEYLNASQTLFRLVAPDLVTFVLQYGFTAGGTLRLPFIRKPFPNLREATFVGVSDSQSWFIDDAETVHQPLFPALTHLSLLAPGEKNLPLPFWSQHAPRVTHLSIAYPQYGENWNELAAAVGVRAKVNLIEEAGWGSPAPLGDSIQQEHSLRPTYPSLRYLLVRPGPGPIGKFPGVSWTRYRARVSALRVMVRRCLEVGVMAALAEAPKDLLFASYYEGARWSWLQRIDEDGDWAGCWGWIAGCVGDEETRQSEADFASLLSRS